MSSIDFVSKNAAAAAFFDRHLVPLARQLADRELYPMRPDTEADSYFIECSEHPGAFVTLDDSEELMRKLVEYWRAEGLDLLAQLGDDLAELAKIMQVADSSGAEVDPFLYVLF